MGEATLFIDLPIEIAYHICSFLKQQEVSSLTASSKAIYRLFRPILYRHPNVHSFTSLTLLSRTFTRATYMGKADHKWSTQECLDQTKTLDVTIDQIKDSARNNGQPPAAILVSRFIQSIVRRCPNLAITLRFAHCQCNHTPVSGLDSETFPRVTKLILFVGRHDPDETLPERARILCAPNAKFWRPLVNGVSFPDCLNLEVRHHWATTPPTHASLDLNETCRNDSYHARHNTPHRRRIVGAHHDLVDRPLRADQIVGPTKGLKRFENVVLEACPELDSLLLMQLLGNPDSVAVNLVKLELRFCNLDYETMAKLLYHAPPNMKHLVLLCWDDDGQYYSSNWAAEFPHLCPLIRDFSKKLVHFEFAASTVCRELFFDDFEIESLKKNGITTGLGAEGGAVENHKKLDFLAISETVEACRRQKRSQRRTSRIQEAITTAEAQSGGTTTSSLFGGVAGGNICAARAQRQAEVSLDEEEEERTRSIEGSKTPWFRRIITWQGLCQPNDTWAEVQLATALEERGIEWVMANKKLGFASQHCEGKLPINLEIGRAFEEKFDVESSRRCFDNEARVDGSVPEPPPFPEL